MPVGSDLEYTDEITLAKAMEGRQRNLTSPKQENRDTMPQWAMYLANRLIMVRHCKFLHCLCPTGTLAVAVLAFALLRRKVETLALLRCRSERCVRCKTALNEDSLRQREELLRTLQTINEGLSGILNPQRRASGEPV